MLLSGDDFKSKREEMGLKPADVASALKISIKTVYNVENGMVHSNSAERYAEYLGLSNSIETMDQVDGMAEYIEEFPFQMNLFSKFSQYLQGYGPRPVDMFIRLLEWFFALPEVHRHAITSEDSQYTTALVQGNKVILPDGRVFSVPETSQEAPSLKLVAKPRKPNPPGRPLPSAHDPKADPNAPIDFAAEAEKMGAQAPSKDGKIAASNASDAFVDAVEQEKKSRDSDKK